MQKPIIPAIDRELLKKELNTSRYLRPTNKAHNDIYIVTAHNSPNVMREIGRLREVSFRSWGGGTGKEIDIDEYDLLPKPYHQLIVWNPDNEEIIGGYRFLPGSDVEMKENGQPNFVMSHLFEFSPKFIKEYLPFSLELGRAFIQPDYQTSKMGMKSLFALDNLWDGLGAITYKAKKAKYFIGKVNIYETYPVKARDMIYEFMKIYFPDKDRLIFPKEETFTAKEVQKEAKKLFTEEDCFVAYKTLQKNVRETGETIPPMFNAYIGLTRTMKMFGTTIDPDFSGTYETGIMVTMPDLIDSKRKRYIDPYIEYLQIVLKEQKEKRKIRVAAREKRREERKKK